MAWFEVLLVEHWSITCLTLFPAFGWCMGRLVGLWAVGVLLLQLLLMLLISLMLLPFVSVDMLVFADDGGSLGAELSCWDSPAPWVFTGDKTPVDTGMVVVSGGISDASISVFVCF